MPSKGTTQRVCPHCSAAFAVRPPEIKRGRRFCSYRCAMASRVRPPYERFWAKVRKLPGSGCWEWQASDNGRGYGKFDGGYAHRWAWEHTHGPIPDDLHVLHRCDNPPCVRPDHLFLGTRSDNLKDAASKGRCARQRHPELYNGENHWMKKSPQLISRGERCKASRLTEADVMAIREARAGRTHTRRELAALYGVTYQAIHLIETRKNWSHLP